MRTLKLHQHGYTITIEPAAAGDLLGYMTGNRVTCSCDRLVNCVYLDRSNAIAVGRSHLAWAHEGGQAWPS